MGEQPIQQGRDEGKDDEAVFRPIVRDIAVKVLVQDGLFGVAYNDTQCDQECRNDDDD